MYCRNSTNFGMIYARRAPIASTCTALPRPACRRARGEQLPVHIGLSNGEELNHKPLDTEVALQLLLACLSTRFKDCKEEDDYPAMCDQILVDYIYGIRNLAGGRLDLERIYKHAKAGKGLPKLPPT